MVPLLLPLKFLSHRNLLLQEEYKVLGCRNPKYFWWQCGKRKQAQLKRRASGTSALRQHTITHQPESPKPWGPLAEDRPPHCEANHRVQLS